jgi:hypothetical protein
MQADRIYSGSQLDELWPRNPVSLRNRVSQHLTKDKNRYNSSRQSFLLCG